MGTPEQNNTPVTIAGAGPAGLAAAITLARAGKQVVVHEAQSDVGWRFQGDFQGLENWSTDKDIISELADYGIQARFKFLPCSQGTAFDAWGRVYPIRSKKPLFYLVERGPDAGSFDKALLSEALSLGIEIKFNSKLAHATSPTILATGPRAADAIAVGYHFETDMADGFWAICDNNLAPMGYAYLLIWNGKGTVKSCMFTDFRNEREYVARTVDAFKKHVGLTMRNPQFHGGAGNFCIPACAVSGQRPVTGEQAGFQDALWGFGIRYAIRSGVLAARSLIEGEDYESLWRKSFMKQIEATIVNRAIYSLLGNRSYSWCLRYQSKHDDARAFLQRLYNPSWLRRLLAPWARSRVKTRRRDIACQHVDCSCVWCRGG